MHPIKQLVPGGTRYQIRRLFEIAEAVVLTGNTFHCPCCNGKFRKMLPAGRFKRPNARCPRCGSLERHRLIWLYLQQKTDFFAMPYKVLDVAPDDFMQKKFRSLSNLDYLSIDLESPIAMRNMDVTKLELPDASFDVIFCNHVFEHIPDDRAAMKELRRVLKPKGFAILQTPIDDTRDTTDEDFTVTDPQERLRRFGQTDHVRVYGRDFFDRLRQSGWDVTHDRFVKTFSDVHAKQYALDPKEDIIIGW